MSSTVVPGQPWSDNPVLDIVEQRLRAFGGADLNRTDAGQLLGLYVHAKDLTVDERSAILRRFPVAEVPPVPRHVEGVRVGRRYHRRSLGGVS